jgi:hypothetical protein
MKRCSRSPAVLLAGLIASNCSAYTSRAVPAGPASAETASFQSQATTVTVAEAKVPAPAAPAIQLFGLPFHLWAPIERPYEPSGYRDLGGQPESADDAVLAQSSNGR